MVSASPCASLHQVRARVWARAMVRVSVWARTMVRVTVRIRARASIGFSVSVRNVSLTPR